MVYADTSLLVSSYLNELNTERAKHLLGAISSPILLSPLSRLEVLNAMQLQVFWESYTRPQVRALLTRFTWEIEQGYYVLGGEDDSDVWKLAEELSGHHTATAGTRSLDIWHVAFAYLHGVSLFLTFDKKQRALAETVGMEVNPL